MSKSLAALFGLSNPHRNQQQPRPQQQLALPPLTPLNDKQKSDERRKQVIKVLMSDS